MIEIECMCMETYLRYFIFCFRVYIEEKLECILKNHWLRRDRNHPAMILSLSKIKRIYKVPGTGEHVINTWGVRHFHLAQPEVEDESSIRDHAE